MITNKRWPKSTTTRSTPHHEFISWYTPMQMIVWESSGLEEIYLNKISHIIDRLKAHGDVENDKMIKFWNYLTEDEKIFLNRCVRFHNQTINAEIKAMKNSTI